MKTVFFLAASLVACGCGAREFVVARDGMAVCRIVRDAEALNDIRFATHDLTNHLARMTGAAFAIVTNAAADGASSVECGTDRARAAALAAAGTLADGEAAVVCDGMDLFIWGAGANGTANGIYVFLERTLGCRWLTPWDEPVVPARRDLRLAPFALVYRPRLKDRWLLTALGSASQVRNGGLFLYRNRANMDDSPNYGPVDRPADCTAPRRVRYSKPPSVHTMFHYLPPSDKDGRKGWFKDHPDWFSLNRKGVRTDKMQACFSNPGACAAFASNFFARVEKGGGRGLFNISQTDDDGDGFCHCADCKACVKKYGTPGAPFFVFLKQTAEELARRHPEAAITFLCYRKTQTQVAPNAAFGRLPDNLVPIFAPIDDNFSKDFAHPDNAETFEEFKRWRAISKDIWTWYYPLPYGGLNAPAGGIGRWMRDLRRLADAGLTGAMFEHDVGYPMGLNTVDLQAWMILKCCENPELDCDGLLREFCTLYYGPAADEMIAYAKALDEIADACPRRLAWNGWYPETVRPAALLRWHALFDAAEGKVRGDALLLQRVRECRSGVDLQTLKNYVRAVRGGYSMSADALYGRITNTLARAYDRRAEKRNRSSKWCVPRRIYERMTANARSWHAIAASGRKLPPPLEDVRAETAIQVAGCSSSGGKAVDLPDAFAGVAVWNQKDSTRPGAFNCGYYDKVAKKVIASKTFTERDIVPDKFQLYHIGTVRLAARGLVYLGGSWLCTQDLQEFYDASSPDRKWDLWISYKFEGPRFKGSVAKENRVLCDRMILVPAVCGGGDVARVRFRAAAADPARAEAAIAAGLGSPDDFIRRAALYELFVRDSRRAFVAAEREIPRATKVTGRFLVEMSRALTNDAQRAAFFAKLSEGAKDPAVRELVAADLGARFHRTNVAKSQDPTLDREYTLTAKFDLPADGWAFAPETGRPLHARPVPAYASAFDDSAWRRIAVGNVWEKQGFPGFNGIGWYRVRFTLPAKPADLASAELCFDGVDEEAWVWLNGTFLGQHTEGPTGWDMPFRFGADAELVWGGENLLVVRVRDSADAGGIWKGVRVEALK